MSRWILVNVELEDYDPTTKRWTKELSIIHHENGSFAKGGIRYAFRAHDCKVQGWDQNPMVLKLHQEKCTEKDVRLQVIMQAKCVKYAQEYNQRNASSKEIRFEGCRLVKFLSGQWSGKFGTIERYIGANFTKHNTVHPEYDGVALTDRNTPQAFSHFTFEKSNKTEIVVDIQGVGDCYTDPQIYSVSAQAPVPPYGMADWGVMGITNFFRNHRCNALCNALGLDPIRGSGENHGTQPRLQTQPVQRYY